MGLSGGIRRRKSSLVEALRPNYAAIESNTLP
jgi:hypothetical protein